MFTKEQLAKWRAMGAEFDSFYDEVAVEKPVKPEKKAISLEKEMEENQKFFDAFPVTTINEDSEERYIRKVLHMVRNFKAKRRTGNILMSTSIYKTKDLLINNYNIKRIILEVKPKNQTYIDFDNIKTLPLKIEIDGKLNFIVSNEDDKNKILEYISNNTGKDDFIPAFSKFNLNTINSEISICLNNPEKIAQKSTPLCGIAAIGFLMIKYHFLNYKYLIQDLYHYAEAFYGTQKFIVKPRNYLFGQVYDIGPEDSLYPRNMDECDYVFLSSIKSSENKIRSYDGVKDNTPLGIDIDGIGGLTLPGELTSLLMNMLSCTEVEDYTRFTRIGHDEIEDLYLMNNAYQNKYECLMLIDSAMFDKSEVSDISFPNHWVTYCGKFEEKTDAGELFYIFKVATWGVYKTVKVNKERFEKTFYGYIKCKLTHGKTTSSYDR